LAAPTNNAGVLDLTPCTNLESIGRYAFGGCSLIEFVHFPSNGKLTIRDDPDTTNDDPGSASVFASTKADSGNNNGCFLIGENAANASYRVVASGCRYPGGALSAKSQDSRSYFKVSSASDVINGNSSLRYWVDLGNHDYLLFDNETKIKTYLGV